MDQNLKHRLTGAIILVSVAVIFIPVILEGPDNEWAPLSHSIPEAPQLDYRARLDVPEPVEAPPRIKHTVIEKPAEPKKTVVPAAKPEPLKPAQGVGKNAAGWYVQVGSFSQKLNASGLSKRLELSGYETRMQKTGAGTGSVWRVMVGPDKTRAAAEKLRDKLAKERQLDGIIINSPG